MKKYNQSFSINFIVPIDLELAEGFGVKNGNEDFDISLSIIGRKPRINGIDSGKTTAKFIPSEGGLKNNVETLFKADFNLYSDSFNDGLDKFLTEKEKSPKLAKRFMEDWIDGKRFHFAFRNILRLLEQIIEAQEYVNNKYHIFPVDLRNIYDIKISYPQGPHLIIGRFGGSFTNDDSEYQNKLIENTKKVQNFINEKEEIFEPKKIIGYSFEFMNQNLLRPAITEAQSAIEHLLEKKFIEKSENAPKESWGFWNKLKKYSNLGGGFNFGEFENDSVLSKANGLRNDIIHGRETPSLTKETCKKYLDIYKKLFDKIYLEEI